MCIQSPHQRWVIETRDLYTLNLTDISVETLQPDGGLKRWVFGFANGINIEFTTLIFSTLCCQMLNQRWNPSWFLVDINWIDPFFLLRSCVCGVGFQQGCRWIPGFQRISLCVLKIIFTNQCMLICTNSYDGLDIANGCSLGFHWLLAVVHKQWLQSALSFYSNTDFFSSSLILWSVLDTGNESFTRVSFTAY